MTQTGGTAEVNVNNDRSVGSGVHFHSKDELPSERLCDFYTGGRRASFVSFQKCKCSVVPQTVEQRQL